MCPPPSIGILSNDQAQYLAVVFFILCVVLLFAQDPPENNSGFKF